MKIKGMDQSADENVQFAPPNDQGQILTPTHTHTDIHTYAHKQTNTMSGTRALRVSLQVKYELTRACGICENCVYQKKMSNSNLPLRSPSSLASTTARQTLPSWKTTQSYTGPGSEKFLSESLRTSRRAFKSALVR